MIQAVQASAIELTGSQERVTWKIGDSYAEIFSAIWRSWELPGATAGSKSLAAAVKSDDSVYQLAGLCLRPGYRSLKQSSFDRTGGNAMRGRSRRARPKKFSAQRARRDHSYLVHHRRQQPLPSEGNRSANVLGWAVEAQRRSAGWRFLRIESRRIQSLSICVSQLLFGQGIELLLCDAISQIRTNYSHQ